MLVARAAARVPGSHVIPYPHQSSPLPACGVLIGESRRGPGFSSLVRQQEFSEFLLVTAGQARLEWSGRVYHLGPGSFVHAPAQTGYHVQDKPGQALTLYTIRYREKIVPARLRRQLGRLGLLHWNLYRCGSPWLRAFSSICEEMLYEQHCRHIGWETVLAARLVDLVVRTTRFGTRKPPHDPPDLEKLSDSLTRVGHYATRLQSEFNRPTTLDEAARTTGLSRRRFTALFRTITGQSWHKYLVGLRLNHARHLLSQTDKIILSVAFESGFEDLSHFNHIFRQVVGCSPSAFRNRESEESGQLALHRSLLIGDQGFEGAGSFTADPRAMAGSRLGSRT
jgi:AraC-like DNA-binding protein